MSSRETAASARPGALPTGADPLAALAISNVSHSFRTPDGTTMTALEDVSISVTENEFFTVVGPTGCGKTTLLNIAAGLITPANGTVGMCKRGPAGPVKPTIGYITQESNLLPWCTVIENIMIGLEARRVPKAERKRRAAEWARRVGLEKFQNHYPRQLSGGMQKRCSIARTMVYEPDIIFMDEPFSALDAITKSVLQKMFLQLRDETLKTIIFITHDLNEAITLSDRVAVMTGRPGRVKTVVDIPFARPRDVYHITRAEGFQDLHDQLWSHLELDLGLQ
jgi:ABC-type nitrate/sulfonate/bicarbonate transport system ATPase subunit